MRSFLKQKEPDNSRTWSCNNYNFESEVFVEYNFRDRLGVELLIVIAHISYELPRSLWELYGGNLTS